MKRAAPDMANNPDPPILVQALITAPGSLIGAFFFFFFFVPGIRIGEYTLANLVWDCSAVVIGALVGGLFFSWASKR